MFPPVARPIWYPPISVIWIATCLIVFFGAVANRISPSVRQVFITPAGFFGTTLAALVCLKFDAIPLGFAILFLLLSVWAMQQFQGMEGFLVGSNTVDWVTNSKRWYVEKTLKERPMGVQEKEVSTYPVQG
jgi:hypothetical protein